MFSNAVWTLPATKKPCLLQVCKVFIVILFFFNWSLFFPAPKGYKACANPISYDPDLLPNNLQRYSFLKNRLDLTNQNAILKTEFNRQGIYHIPFKSPVLTYSFQRDVQIWLLSLSVSVDFWHIHWWEILLSAELCSSVCHGANGLWSLVCIPLLEPLKGAIFDKGLLTR